MIKANLALYREALRQSGGQPEAMQYPMQQMVYVAKTNEEAWRDAAPYFEWYFSTISRLIASERNARIADTYGFYKKSQAHLGQVRMQDLWENRTAAVGDPSRVADILTMIQSELGMNHLMAWVGVGGMPHDKVMRSMELLKNDVMPRVRIAVSEATR